MLQILNLVLRKLRNSEYFKFMNDIRDLIVRFTAVALNIEEDFEAFLLTLAKLDEELNIDKGTSYTEKLYEQDLLRDRTWSALNERIKATLMCPIPKEVEAAKALKRVFDTYGNIRYLSYNEETGRCTNLSTDLEKEENTAHCSTIGITKWAAAFKTQNIEFINIQNERDTEAKNKNSGNVKEVRIELDALYEAIVNRIHAIVTLKMTTPEIEDFIEEVNQKIKINETTLAAREGRREAEEDEEQPIAEVD